MTQKTDRKHRKENEKPEIIERQKRKKSIDRQTKTDENRIDRRKPNRKRKENIPGRLPENSRR